MYPEVKARLLDWEPGEIPNHDIRDWYFAAVFDVSFPINVIRWFLPRILEGLARHEDMAATGEEVLLQRLGMAGFPGTFTDPEIDLVNRFAAAYLEAVLGEEEKSLDLDTALCMFALGGVDLAPLLARVDAAPTDLLVNSMREGRMAIEIGFTAFWVSGLAKDAALGWFTSDRTVERLIAFASGTGCSEEQREAAWGLAERAMAH